MADNDVLPDSDVLPDNRAERDRRDAARGPAVRDEVVRDEVVREEVVVEERDVLTPDPLDPGSAEREQAIVVENENKRRLDDGSVETTRTRTEQRRRAGTENLGWVVALLALLALAALGGWWYLTQEDTAEVPAVVGMTRVEAVSRLNAEGFDTRTSTTANDAAPGSVVGQQPAGGTEVDEGSVVVLEVSGGPATRSVPNAVGLSEPEARDRLVEAGLLVTSRKVFADQPVGVVVAQNPAAGSDVEPDSEVTINVSQGSGLVDVPDVVGLTRAEAEAELQDAGLTANVVEVPADDPPGTVVAQNPVGGTLRQGSAVRLNVSIGR